LRRQRGLQKVMGPGAGAPLPLVPLVPLPPVLLRAAAACKHVMHCSCARLLAAAASASWPLARDAASASGSTALFAAQRE
jgi:hypothetical protein